MQLGCTAAHSRSTRIQIGMIRPIRVDHTKIFYKWLLKLIQFMRSALLSKHVRVDGISGWRAEMVRHAGWLGSTLLAVWTTASGLDVFSELSWMAFEKSSSFCVSLQECLVKPHRLT